MKKLKDTIPSLFEDNKDPRIDYYIDKIRDSYKTTNQLFLANTILILLLIISFHLLRNGYLNQVSIFGQNFQDSPLLRKWGLIIPSILFMVNCFMGYLRVYQKESIEWLLAKYRPKEYETGIYKLTFPSNFILGMELLYKSERKSLFFIPNLIVASVTTIGPVIYIFLFYYNLLKTEFYDVQIYLSGLICLTSILIGIYAIVASKKI